MTSAKVDDLWLTGLAHAEAQAVNSTVRRLRTDPSPMRQARLTAMSLLAHQPDRVAAMLQQVEGPEAVDGSGDKCSWATETTEAGCSRHSQPSSSSSSSGRAKGSRPEDDLPSPPGIRSGSPQSPRSSLPSVASPVAWQRPPDAPANAGKQTTVMLKCLNKTDSVHSVREFLDSLGLAGEYDYLYVPVVFNEDTRWYENNFGFGVVNFRVPSTAEWFRTVANQVSRGGRRLKATWARLQGVSKNLHQVQERRRTGKLTGYLYEAMVPWVFEAAEEGRSVGAPVAVAPVVEIQ
mmetsp:Transcript_34492/g.75461  ORF Transcript_34492/g.75461 Transcript_34492/m.75461 type:complete len:292 (+) Transcript_34492:62-937(+)